MITDQEFQAVKSVANWETASPAELVSALSATSFVEDRTLWNSDNVAAKLRDTFGESVAAQYFELIQKSFNIGGNSAGPFRYSISGMREAFNSSEGIVLFTSPRQQAISLLASFGTWPTELTDFVKSLGGHSVTTWTATGGSNGVPTEARLKLIRYVAKKVDESESAMQAAIAVATTAHNAEVARLIALAEDAPEIV